jgi:hypothetical protein
MAAAAAGAGKTPRLQLVVAAAAAVIPQAHRQAQQLAVAADSQHRQGRVLTFRASQARLVPATVTTAIWAVVAVVVLPMLPLQTLAAGRCLVAAVAGLAAEPPQFLLQTAQLRAAGRPRLLEPAVRRAFLARHLHPATQVRQATGLSAVWAAAVVARLLRLLPMAQQAVRVVLEAAVAVAVVVAAIRVLAARVASAVLATVS